MHSTTIIVVIAVMVSTALAQVWLLPGDDRLNPYKSMWARTAYGGGGRDITWNSRAGSGNVFGTLGSNDNGLFGKAGYQQTIFNDARGKLDAQAYGTRVLSPAGDSSQFGGKLDFANDNAKASLDISKQIHGRTTVEASGAGVWNPDKNTRVSVGGAVSQTGGGKPDIGVNAQVEHKF